MSGEIAHTMTEAVGSNRMVIIRSLLQQPYAYLSSLPDEAVISASLTRRQLSVLHNDQLEYPSTKERFDLLWGEHRSFIASDVDQISSIARGLRHVLQTTFNRHVRVSLYMSQKGRGALEPHIDTYPVWWFQLDGEKELSIDTGASELESRVLRPGDGAFIPQGVRHSAVAITDSRHLCAGLHQSFSADRQ